MKELILHFGIHRTGTTTTQAVLSRNKGILKSHGILYPNLFGLKDHVKIPWWLKNKKITPNDILQEIEKEDKEFIDKIVLSAEDFCILKDLSFLIDWKKKYDVKVVIYLKEQVAWLESWYNQHLKWPWDRKFSSSTVDFFVDNIDDFYWIDYHKTFSLIMQEIDAKRLYIKPVSDFGIKDTTRDFFDFLGLPVEKLHPFKNSNESLTKGQLEIIRRIDLYGMSPNSRTKVIDAVRGLKIRDDIHGKASFNNNHIERISYTYRKSNLCLYEQFFDGKDVLGTFPSRDFAPLELSDDEVYKKYLPQIIKSIADPQK
mgnify:CR=1 FL=1|tara:strand:+ start:1401 stop:2342 length:942 start_codon:yes stop_codon:yes gene_type:complete